MFNLVKQARTALTHLSPEKVRHHANRAVHIGMVAHSSAAYADMEDFLIPSSVAHEKRLERMEYVHRAGDPGAPEDVDLVVYYEGIQGPHGTYVFHPSEPDATVAAILKGNDDIALPLARPVVGLVGFFAFVASWNNFFLPFVMTYDNSQYPLQIGLQQLIGSTASFNPANYSAGSSVEVLHRPDLAMAVIVAIVPVLLVFLFAQRTLVTGMLAGATKE